MTRGSFLVGLAIVTATFAAYANDAGVQAPKPNNYSWCDPGCPETKACLKHNGGSYCVPTCSDHTQCSTGYCGKNDVGTRVCAPIHAMLLACKWGEGSQCVSSTIVTGQSCGSTTSWSVTYRNDCTSAVRLYTCITTPTGPWHCEHDDNPNGLAPGQSYTHTVCKGAGYHRYYATPMTTHAENFCLDPRP